MSPRPCLCGHAKTKHYGRATACRATITRAALRGGVTVHEPEPCRCTSLRPIDERQTTG